MSRKQENLLDYEIRKTKLLWFRTAKQRGWDNDIRDFGWKQLEKAILANRRCANMRRAKANKRDDARTLLSGDPPCQP